MHRIEAAKRLWTLKAEIFILSILSILVNCFSPAHTREASARGSVRDARARLSVAPSDYYV
jgi:hypothetical protein